MTQKNPAAKIGFTCAYAPLPVIEAAGFAPYRILPLGDAPDQAGQWLHDNLCPHVKRVLDRAMSNDLPELAGMVIVNSCDTMRRLADAWRQVRPHDPLFLLDLPMTPDNQAVSFFTNEIKRLAETLVQWSGQTVSENGLHQTLATYNALAQQMARAREATKISSAKAGRAKLQKLCNTASTSPMHLALQSTHRFLAQMAKETPATDGVPIFLFGNLLPDPEAFELLESSGACVVDDDLCTSSRVFSPVSVAPGEDPFRAMATALLQKPPWRVAGSGRPGGKADPA